MNLKPLEYYAISPYDFDIMVLAKCERDKHLEKVQLINTRLVCWVIYQANVDPKKAAKNIEEFMPLDGKKPVKKLTQAYLRKQKALLEARLKNI